MSQSMIVGMSRRAPQMLGWLFLAASVHAQEPVRGKDSAPAASAYASSRLLQYLPLESIRSGTVRMPEALARLVSVTLQKVPLQRVLMQIATQAGLGLCDARELLS